MVLTGPPPTQGLVTYLMRDIGKILQAAPTRRGELEAYLEALDGLVGGRSFSLKSGKSMLPVVVSAQQRRVLVKARAEVRQWLHDDAGLGPGGTCRSGTETIVLHRDAEPA